MRILKLFKSCIPSAKPTSKAQAPASPMDVYTPPASVSPPGSVSSSAPGAAPEVAPSAPGKQLKGVARVQREFRDMLGGKMNTEGYGDLKLVDDNIMRWSVKLALEEGTLAQGLRQQQLQGHPGTLQLRIDFPNNYPAQAPFIWLESPRLEYQTGFISRGAVCMEMLVVTGGANGWKSNYTLESVLQTLRANFQVPQAFGMIHSWQPYTEEEARGGLARARQGHKSGNWVG
jgi:ubiquitin-protein ligase